MKVLPEIDAKLSSWIVSQRLFFVGTAPLRANGHVNLSPKGGDALRVLGPHRVAYQDYTGSGAETIAHLRENGRIVVMLCAFEGPPQIIRLHGQGRALTPGMVEFDELAAQFPSNPGTRAIVDISVQRVASSCGFSIPFLEYQRPRETLDTWANKRGAEGLAQYRIEKNSTSIDGLPSIGSDHLDAE